MNCLYPMYKGRSGIDGGSGIIGGCGAPTKFVARHENEDTASIFACGKHLAASLDKPGVYIVVAVKKEK